mgnify:CR=1 FL=1
MVVCVNLLSLTKRAQARGIPFWRLSSGTPREKRRRLEQMDRCSDSVSQNFRQWLVDTGSGVRDRRGGARAVGELDRSAPGGIRSRDRSSDLVGALMERDPGSHRRETAVVAESICLFAPQREAGQGRGRWMAPGAWWSVSPHAAPGSHSGGSGGAGGSSRSTTATCAHLDPENPRQRAIG